MTRKIDLSNIRVTIGGGPAGWHSIAEAVRMVSLAFSCDVNTARSGILRRGQRGMMNACCGGFAGFLPADLQQEMTQLRPLFPSFPVGQFLWSRAEIQDLSNSFWTFGDAALNFDDRELTAVGVRLSPLHVAALIAGHDGTSVTTGGRNLGVIDQNSPTGGLLSNKGGSLRILDQPLIEEMDQIIGRTVPSVRAAALIVAERAAGGGTVESKAIRLANRWRKWKNAE